MNTALPKTTTRNYNQKPLPENTTRNHYTKSLPEITDNLGESVVYSYTRKVIQNCFLLMLIIQIQSSLLKAQWSSDPSNHLIVGYGLIPTSCSDGTGGCYIVYEQNLGYPRKLVVERLNKYGYKAWSNSVQIRGKLPSQVNARITEDGYNGVIISYMDLELYEIGGKARVRVQRVDSSGNILWDIMGQRVSIADVDEDEQEIVSDGDGGCIVAWVLDDTGDLRINRISNGGERVWADSGIYVWHSPAKPFMLSDGKRGVIMIYGMSRIQRFDGLGNPLWGISGIQQHQLGIQKVVLNSFGGIVIGGTKFLDYNNGNPIWRVTCQRISQDGLTLWSDSGIVIDDSVHNVGLKPPSLVLESNFDGGAIIGWDKRIESDTLRSFAQRLSGDGIMYFRDSSISISNIDTSWTSLKTVTSSLNDSKIFVFIAGRSNGYMFVQQIDTTGKRLWDENDVVISTNSLEYFNTITDGDGGVISVGFIQSDFSIRALKVSRNGKLGEIINSVEDKKKQFQRTIFALLQNYPNPFNSQTVIKYEVPQNDWINISLFNILGEKLSTLVNNFHFSGNYFITFDANNFPSGVYVYVMQTQQQQLIQKLQILK